ncbi:MAG: DUF2807 domain-containing protein [Flavobacteriaceae bacterium]
MKNRLLACLALLSSLAYAQKTETLDKFASLDSDIGATINIVKSDAHKISLEGDESALGHIHWEIDDKNLKIRSDKANMDYSEVVITVQTPSLQVLALTDGGKATMDKKFSRLDSFVVSASDDATIDLSNIEFRTLVATSNDGGQIIYKDASTFVSTSGDGGKVKSIQ